MDDQPPRGYVAPPSAPPTPVAAEARGDVRPREPAPVERPLDRPSSEPPSFYDPAPPRRSWLRRLIWLLLLAIVIAVRVSSRGPIVFRSPRRGSV